MTPIETQAQAWHCIIPGPGSDAQFEAVRGILTACGYREEPIFERLGIAGPADYKPVWLGGSKRREAGDALDALILLLMDGEYVAGETLERLLPSGAVAHLEALRLISRDPRNPERWFGGCTLFPTRGLLLASDRASAPDGSMPPPGADVVYPAAIDSTVLFMSTLSDAPCEALLDLGTGSGVAALWGSRFARQVWGTDIAARSVQFAEFNRRLNGVANVTMLAGDMYQPVEGLTFDRIVTHPPCVPARETAMIFRDGGEDGEQILRRTVEEMPRFLRPGGSFYTIATAADCEGEAFEDRIRLWLGPAAAEFDLVLTAHRRRGLREVAVDSFLAGSAAVDDIRYRNDMWARRKTKAVVHFSFVLRRHEGTLKAFTVRVSKGRGYNATHVEWLLRWGAAMRNPSWLQRLTESRPRLSPFAEMSVIHRVREGQMAADAFFLRCSRPFDVERRIPPWLAQVVSQCDGSLTWREQLANAQEAGLVPPKVSAADFLTVLDPLVSQGLLWIEEVPLPEAAG